MTEIRWLTPAIVTALHRESIERFGGSDGIRDGGALESALARPRNRAAYEEDVSLFALAAEYCFGLARNHLFVDGNKRSSVLAATAFLALNGYAFAPPESSIVQVIVALAAGEIDVDELTTWFEEFSSPRGD